MTEPAYYAGECIQCSHNTNRQIKTGHHNSQSDLNVITQSLLSYFYDLTA